MGYVYVFIAGMIFGGSVGALALAMIAAGNTKFRDDSKEGEDE